MGVKKFIKKSVAFVAAAAMALTMVVAPVGAEAGASYAAEGTEDNLHLNKGIELQSNGNYKITLEAYSTGQDTITTTEEAVPLDIVLVLDQSGSMSKRFGNTTRLEALKNAVTNFVSTVQADATKNDVNHRISMVGFASTKTRSSTYKNTEILTVTDNSAVNYKPASDNNTTFENALKNSLMNVRTQSSKITQAINRLDAEGDTYSEYGMDMASRILAKYPVQEGENRKQIIVMFTDGYTAPSGTNNIDYTMSDRAIANAKVAKDNGATVYTIGIFDGANPNMDINNNYQYDSTNSNKQLVAANRYMNLVSSNYPQAENMTTTGTKVAKASYYQSASNATELNNIFESISKSETTSGTTVKLNSNSILRDVISDKFELPEGTEASSIKVYTAESDQVGNDGSVTWKNRVEAKTTDYPVSINENKVDVTGFDYSTNYVTKNHPGKKLIVEILVNGLQSGIDMYSNDTEQAKSGIYKNSTETTAVKNFVSPKVTIPEYSYVLDYGKKVTIPNTDQSQNKAYSETTQINSTKAAPSTSTSIKKTYGTFALENNTLAYQPRRINWDGFDSIFSFGKKTGDEYEWSKTNVIPATSVYYEDDFGTDDNGDANVAIVWTGTWGKGTSNGGKQDSTNSKYGWDSSYEGDTGFSNGSAHYSSEKLASATFRFKGTGVDVYSRTNDGVGKIIATLKKVTKNENGTESLKTIKNVGIDNLSVSGDYYQIPTLNFDGLDYATYEVTIKVVPVLNSDKTVKRATYYLDGIRVYNPLGKVDANSTAGKAYEEANESNAQYIQVRKDLLDSSKVQAIDTAIKGSLFIDKSEDTVGDRSDSIGTYKEYGPKNEVYLKKDQGVAFTINNYNSNKNKVFIGLKSPTGKNVTVKITTGSKYTTKTISSAADLYYELTPTSDGKVVIENTNDNLLSITKVRITTKNSINGLTADYSLTSTPELMSYVNSFDTLQEEQDTTQKDTEDTLDKGDVDIDNPSDNNTNTDNDKQDNNNQQNQSNNIWNKIISSIKGWFRR
ncbi:hypothetical protein HMPREF0977_01535 [Clostridium sp. 1_1_41A1FAA]|nr:hypothetical protein HMPREF0977_01535 [Clostridium sp. 1_1_41A1FAA]